MSAVAVSTSECVSLLISKCPGLTDQSMYIVMLYTIFIGFAVWVMLRFFFYRGGNRVAKPKVQFSESHSGKSRSLSLSLSNEEIFKMNPTDVVPLISGILNPSLSPAENAQNLLRSLLLTAKGLSETERLCIAYCMQVFLKKPEELTVPQSLLESHDPGAMGDEVDAFAVSVSNDRCCIIFFHQQSQALPWQVEDVDGSVHEWLRSEFTRAVCSTLARVSPMLRISLRRSADRTNDHSQTPPPSLVSSCPAPKRTHARSPLYERPAQVPRQRRLVKQTKGTLHFHTYPHTHAHTSASAHGLTR
jgi:hypothetical protein